MEDIGAPFDGSRAVPVAPVIVSTAAKVATRWPEPDRDPDRSPRYERNPRRIATRVDVQIPAEHLQENDPVWAAVTTTQIVSSSGSLIGAVAVLPAMVAVGGFVLGGLFAFCAAAVAVQAGIETYQVVRRSFN